MTQLVVELPGLLTTVQDAGRWGYQALGVPVAGAMDPASYRAANALAGNHPSAAALEITLSGPSLVAEGTVTVAVAGAEIDVLVAGRSVSPPLVASVADGDRIAFGARRAGARAYLAASGGIETPLVLGSRAADLRSRFPGLAGRALRARDRLGIGTPSRRRGSVDRAERARLPEDGEAVLRVLPGIHSAGLLEELVARAWTVSGASDRMGYRLDGPALEAAAGDLVSMPTVTGAVQVLPGGRPILLMADRQTIGGYAQAAVVIAADLPLAGQLAPGDRIRFRCCSRGEAIGALVASEQRLLALEEPS